MSKTCKFELSGVRADLYVQMQTWAVGYSRRSKYHGVCTDWPLGYRTVVAARSSEMEDRINIFVWADPRQFATTKETRQHFGQHRVQ
jgi:hypothetical protein